MPIERVEKALYGAFAIAAVIMFASLSFITFPPSANDRLFLIGSFFALIIMGISIIVFKFAKRVVEVRKELENPLDEAGDESLR